LNRKTHRKFQETSIPLCLLSTLLGELKVLNGMIQLNMFSFSNSHCVFCNSYAIKNLKATL
jgi:hypothetical protein